jgi:hypothetical protein
LFIAVKAYHPPVADLMTRYRRQLNRHTTLYCEGPACGHRIAWLTPLSFVHWLNGSTSSRWRWQGRRVPIRERRTEDGIVVDLKCFRCEWKRTYPWDELPRVAA